jgi:hypothetical protein
MPSPNFYELLSRYRADKAEIERSLMLYQSHAQSTEPLPSGNPEASSLRRCVSALNELIAAMEAFPNA